MTYAAITGMRSARHPLQGCGHVGDCGCAGVPVLAVSGSDCGCAGLGGKFDAPAASNTFTTLTGLTTSQMARVTDLRMRHIMNTGLAIARLGPAAPEISFSDILHLDATKLALSSNPGQLARSAVLYAIARCGQLIERLPGLYRGQNQGIPGAEALAADLNSLAETGVSGVRTTLDIVFSLLPSRSATSGLGNPWVIAGVAVAVSAALAVAVVALSYFLLTSESKIEQADEYCAGRLRSTGVACNPEQYRAYIDSLPPQSQDFLSNTLNKMGDATSSVLKYALIGGGVLILGVVGYNYFLYRTGKSMIKSPTGRKTLAANRKRSSRRRTSRGRR